MMVILVTANDAIAFWVIWTPFGLLCEARSWTWFGYSWMGII